MKIDGRAITSVILSKLKKKVAKLKEKNITPTMAIILMGENEASAIYVKQKGIKAKEIGAQVNLFHFKQDATNEKIERLIKRLDKNPKIHGIILQRPAPKNINANALTELIHPTKEVDGFGSSSKYPVPVAQAVLLMLKNAFGQLDKKTSFSDWLKSKRVVVIGKGETAGRPIIELLSKKGTSLIIVDSHTKNRDKLIKNSDIVVSAVGKAILKSKDVKNGVILIGVGLYIDKQGKLRGDYEDEDMDRVAHYYSPTPGGVGPVNVACLMQNLVKAAENSIK